MLGIWGIAGAWGIWGRAGMPPAGIWGMPGIWGMAGAWGIWGKAGIAGKPWRWMLMRAVVMGMRLALLPGSGLAGGGAKVTSTRPSAARRMGLPVWRAIDSALAPTRAGGVVRTSEADSGGAAGRREIAMAAGGAAGVGRGRA